MAKIVRANDITLNNQSRIDISTAAREGSGLIAQGYLAQQTADVELQKRQYSINQQISDTIDSETQKIFNESKSAYQASTLMDKMNAATESFVRGKLNRYKTTVDDKGNYTYQSLPKDIENIGNTILQNTLKEINDPEVAQQFQLRFKGYISNQKISALQEATKQQMVVGLESLDKGLGTIINQASQDNIGQMNTYYNQGIQSLKDALVGGIISKPDYEQKAEQFRLILKDKVLRNAINVDRNTAAQALNKPATELGITEDEKAKYKKLLDTTLKSDQIAVKKAEELQAIDRSTEEASIIEDLTARMKADVLREDELLAFDGLISPNKFSQMKTEYVKQAKQREAERQHLAGLASRLREGDNLNNVSSGDIDNIYNHMLEQRAHITKSQPTLSEQAEIAALIPQPVREFATNLNTNVKQGSIKNATEILAAYTYIKDRNKPSLARNFDADATAVMEYTEMLVNKGGVSAEDALVQAREKVFNSSNELQRDLLKDFDTNTEWSEDFKLANIQETAASELGIKTGIYGFRSNNISQAIAYDYKNFVREGYRKLGDIESAKNYAKQIMNRRYGKSKITGETQYMLNPPEKIWGEDKSEDLRNILLEDITPLIEQKVFSQIGISDDKKNIMDIVLNSINIHSDDKTSNLMTFKLNEKGEIINEQTPTWTVTYIDPVTGLITPVLNPETGQIKRWSPVGSTYYDTKRAKLLSEATAKAEREKENRATQTQAQRELEEMSIKPGLI